MRKTQLNILKEVDILARIRTVCVIIQVLIVITYTSMWVYLQLHGAL